MYFHNLDPIIFNLGIISLRWYSLAYILGILLGWWIGKKIILYKSNSQEMPSKEDFDDFISYIIIAIILGGRLGYVLLYNFSFYLKNPIDIFKIWEGGMSFHGALIGVVIATYYFSNSEKRSLKSF